MNYLRLPAFLEANRVRPVRPLKAGELWSEITKFSLRRKPSGCGSKEIATVKGVTHSRQEDVGVFDAANL